VDEFMAINNKAVNNSEELLMQPGSILRLVKGIQQEALSRNETQTHYQNACITIPRCSYSAVETETFRLEHAQWIDPRQFDTLQWLYKSSSERANDGLAKAIADVSQLKSLSGRSVHRPFDVCPSATLPYDQPLGIHHHNV
jgi:hypothetical protein